MSNIDPDILHALKAHDVTGERVAEITRQLKARKSHRDQTERRIETQLEFLIDEIEAVLPRTHPKFKAVLVETFVRRFARRLDSLHQPDESPLEKGWPKGW